MYVAGFDLSAIRLNLRRAGSGRVERSKRPGQANAVTGNDVERMQRSHFRDQDAFFSHVA